MMRQALSGSLAWSGRKARKIAALLVRLETRLSIADEHTRTIAESMEIWDALNNPDEPYYTDRYMEWIGSHLQGRGCDLSRSFVDLGCGPGRLLVPIAELLAKHGGRLTGVELLEWELEKARAQVRSRGLTNVTLVHSDLLTFLRAQPAASFEGILCLEVLYLVKDLESVMAELHRVLRPEGLLLVNFVPQYYLAACGVFQRQWDMVEMVLTRRCGELPGMGWHNWHASHEVTALLEQSGFRDVGMRGLGVFSGIDGDPLAFLAQPSRMSDGDRAELANLENRLGSLHPDTGRYILAVAVRDR